MGDVSLLVRKTNGSMLELYFTNIVYIANATNNIVSGQVWKEKGIFMEEVQSKILSTSTELSVINVIKHVKQLKN